jgi:hypothetical protein
MADGLTWDDLPTELEGPGTEIRRKDFGGLAICLIRLQVGLRTDPLFAGLPDDRCQSPHWGYVIKGKLTFRYGDRSETYEAGDAYYAPPGHTPVLYAGTEIVEFSPTEELQRTIEAVTRNLQG